MNKKQITFILNPNRIKYLMDLYHLKSHDFIELIHSNAKRKTLALNDVELNHIMQTGTKVDISIIKLIDKTFNKGLTWYISKRNLPAPDKSSIFFRKDTFNTDTELDFESKKVVNKYEELKIEIQTLCKFINVDLKKLFNTYNIKYNPQQAAHEVRVKFNKTEQKLIKEKFIFPSHNERDFLKNAIRILEELNIFVFEFTENWNKINKASFNGFYISPNIIVIKRQHNYRREIFTLFHELAHYLINDEEIDNITDNQYIHYNPVEQWCHSFSFYFLVDMFKTDFSELNKASSLNDFHKNVINKLYRNTYLSYSAFYTRLRIENKITKVDYKTKMEELKSYSDKHKLQDQLKKKLEREAAKEQGKTVFAIPRAIESNLFKEIVKINYFAGNINESRLRDYLHISDKKSIDAVIY